MNKTFEKQWRVLENECDISQRISLARIMQHAQQMGSDHLATMNIDYRKMYEDGMVFVVNKMRIHIARRPRFGEGLMIQTLPKEPKGIQFVRDTLFYAGEKQEISVSISWALIDPVSRKLLRPSVFDRYGFTFLPNDGEMVTGYKIRRPESGEGVFHQRQIHYSDLDYNGHVNNTVYSDIICDLLPLEVLKEKEIREFGIIYHKEALPGQVLEMEVIESAGGCYYVAACVDGKSCFTAEIRFK